MEKYVAAYVMEKKFPQVRPHFRADAAVSWDHNKTAPRHRANGVHPRGLADERTID